MKLFTWTWWKRAGERALAQAAEAILPLVLAGALFQTDLWIPAIGVGVGGAIASLVFSLAALPELEGKVLSTARATVYRLTRTAAAAAAGVIGTHALDIFAFDWKTAAMTVLTVTVVAALKVAALDPPETDAARVLRL